MSKRRASRSASDEEWNSENAILSSSDSDSDVGESASKKPKIFKKWSAKKSNANKKRKTGGQTREPAQSYAGIPKIKDSMHPGSRHSIRSVGPPRTALLQWFATVHDSRGMPWRKPCRLSQGSEERSQRAYEVWVSEVMLQQTQVATVIPYYNRWMETFPTLRDLAKADVDQVNALWKGLGYYSRASRLLEGAKIAVKDYGGRLPDNAKEMQAKIPGIGRYSAGAICSIAYGERVPVLDGNVHRLLSRLLALHSPPKAKATLDILWNAARDIVQGEGEVNNIPYPGDVNQALIELGSTVCKVRDPSCKTCPLQQWCSAYSLASQTEESPILDIEDACSVCRPIATEWAVTAFPMKADRKKAREELDIVNVVEWRRDIASHQRFFLLVRRPETGMLARLLDFATSVDVSKNLSEQAVKSTSLELLGDFFGQRFREPPCPPSERSCGGNIREVQVTKMSIVGDVSHVFSHIKKTYRVVWILMTEGDGPPEIRRNFMSFSKITPIGKGKRKDSLAGSKRSRTAPTKGMWIPLDEVAGATMGTGSVKVWDVARKSWEGDVATS